MKKLFLLVIGASAVFAMSTAASLAADPTPRVMRWIPNDISIDTTDGSLWYGWYDFNYNSGGITNWTDTLTSTTNAIPPDSIVDSLRFTSANTDPTSPDLGWWNLRLTSTTTIGGTSYSDGTNSFGIYLTGVGTKVIMKGAPLTFVGTTTTSDNIRSIDLQNNTSLTFANEVTIRADKGAGASPTTNGIKIFTWGATASVLQFDNLKIGRALTDDGNGDYTTNLLPSQGGSSQPDDKIIIKKLSDAGVGDTGILSFRGMYSYIYLGDTTNFSGIVNHANGNFYLTGDLGQNATLNRSAGNAFLTPSAGATLNIYGYFNVTGGGSSFKISGNGAVNFTRNLTWSTWGGGESGNHIVVGGNAGDNVRLGGNFTMTVDGNKIWRGTVIRAGGGVTNEFGSFTLEGGLDLRTSTKNYFTFDANNVWNTITVKGQNGNWKNFLNANFTGSFILSDPSNPADVPLSYTAFSFDGKGLFVDEATYTLFSAPNFNGTTQNGFWGNIDTTIFTIDSNWDGQLGIAPDGKSLFLTVYSTVPEPTAWGLMGMSLFVVTLFRRKKIS